MTEQRHAGGGAPRHRVLLVVAICVLVAALAVGIVVGVSALPTRRGHAAAGGAAPRSATVSPSPVTSSRTPAAVDPVSPSVSASASPSAAPSLGGLAVSPGDPQAATKVAVANAYLTLINVWDDLSMTRSIDFTSLGEAADGDLLTAIEDEIQTQLYAKNRLQKGRSVISDVKVTSISADGQVATLTACNDGSQVSIVDANTGAVIYPAKPARIADSVTMRVRDGRWKATGLTHPGYC